MSDISFLTCLKFRYYCSGAFLVEDVYKMLLEPYQKVQILIIFPTCMFVFNTFIKLIYRTCTYVALLQPT